MGRRGITHAIPANVIWGILIVVSPLLLLLGAMYFMSPKPVATIWPLQQKVNEQSLSLLTKLEERVKKLEERVDVLSTPPRAPVSE